MIVVNENEYAQIRIKNKDVGENVYTTLSILAKYYYSQGMKRKAVCIELQNFLEVAYPKYSINKSYWTEVIEKTANKNAKEKLFESDGVWITESEWEKIQALGNKILGKLAFTLLCIAKINNQRRSSNNNWVNTDIKEIYKLANISCSVDLRAKRIGTLIHSGLAEFAKRVDNLNLKVLFVDDGSKKKFIVNDFRDLGNEYLYRIGENYIRCAECGKLIKNNKNGTKKYCNTCAAYVPQEMKQVKCIDCGKIFVVDARITNKVRCDDCQVLRDRENARKRKQRQRNKEMSRCVFLDE